jgi:hypothetical protein
MRLSSTFQKISRSFAIEFDELAKEIDHTLSSGESREYALATMLRAHLPRRVGVDRGFVIDAHGNTSKQQDIIIFDRTVGTVFEVGHTKYYPCESVIAVGEVKANITSTANLIKALDNIRSVKQLDRSNNGTNRPVTGPGYSIELFTFEPSKIHRDQIFGFIFTSDSLATDTLIESLKEFNRNNPRQVWPNLFCDFKRILISYECRGGLYPSAMDATFLYATEDSEKANLLLLFYCILATFVDEAHVARPSYFTYPSIDETLATYHPLQ